MSMVSVKVLKPWKFRDFFREQPLKSCQSGSVCAWKGTLAIRHKQFILILENLDVEEIIS